MGFLLSGSPWATPPGGPPLAARLAGSGPRIHDQARRSHFGPLEPELPSVVFAKARPRPLGLEQRAFVVAPAVTCLVQRHGGLVPRETRHPLDRRQRAAKARRADLELKAPVHGFIPFETI